MTSPVGLPRVLTGFDAEGGTMTLRDHERVHGPLPTLAEGELTEVVAASGLRGRGGADFPAARKLRAVAGARRASAVVVNGSETEPASRKDRTLLARAPHLVLDGAQLAAEEVRVGAVIVKLCENEGAVIDAVQRAIGERAGGRVEFTMSVGPSGYVTGEESAVMNHLNAGVSKPTLTPPRPFERGYGGRPTLIHNPETLAQMALVARHGEDWYRELGTREDPGSALVTISGAVTHAGVYELAFGTPMADLVAAAGGASEPLQALLVGGYFGTWLPAAEAMELRLAREDLQSVGCSLGAGVVIALGSSSCGLHESARVIGYLADQSAGQCGPCVHGLAAVADGFAALAEGVAPGGSAEQLLRWCAEIRGRGACHHPNGAVRFVESSLRAFGQTIDEHRRGRCAARPAGLPLAVAHTAGAEPTVGAGARRDRIWR